MRNTKLTLILLILTIAATLLPITNSETETPPLNREELTYSNRPRARTRELTSHHIYGTDIQEIVIRMKEISSEIEERAKEMGAKEKLVLRGDPQIKSLWRARAWG